ncbi:MAG: gliding motility lipoprotein GldD [Prevotellaceae bacterium]|jgi:gliding motility-associated lipoprotein GldD|nr:gliding motility lipoprotein GldD [Prevotellaceae bacterium]
MNNVKSKSKITERLFKGAIMLIFISSCSNYIPKPKGYLRFDLPEKEYQLFDSVCPFKFEYPLYGKMIPNEKGYCWYDLYFPQYSSTIYLSYNPINNNFAQLLDDTHEFLYRHSVKADAIEEQFVQNKHNIAGLLFDIGGNAASSVQFFVTDSINHFLRGSLYFYSTPNRDSLAPLINFFREDIERLMLTVEFKTTVPVKQNNKLSTN